jgi:type II secretory pathway component PulF
MNTDEFAFVNRQLAGMLQAGIPLEGALRRVTAEMRRGGLRDELTALESDLRGGAPLSEAVTRRRLPLPYVHLLRVGAKSGDLPGMLNLVADHYQRMHSLSTRLKGLAVYPVLVLGAGLGLSLLLTFIITAVMREFGALPGVVQEGPWWGGHLTLQLVALWFLPVLLLLVTLALGAVLSVPRWRMRLRDWWPGFREARLAQIASTLALLLRPGSTLSDAIGLVRGMEEGTRAEADLARWQERIAAGEGRFLNFATPGRFFPPLFLWLVASAGENLPAGFQRAADLYQARADYRVDLMLYAFLPVSVLFLGGMLVGEAVPLLRFFTDVMQSLGDMGM